MGLFTFGRIRSITRAPDRRQELEYFGAYGSQQKKFWNPPDDGLRNGNPFPSHLKQLSAKSREAARFSCVNLLVTDLAPNCHPDRDNTQQSYPDLDDTSALSSPRRCNSLSEPIPGCKTFHVPKDDASKETEVSVTEDPDPNPDAEPDASDTGSTLDLTDQVLVFRYRGKFHAVYHQCPHSSFPLSKGVPFDIEDFGIVLSAGLTCPRHGWSFDLFSGWSDRGNYRLKVWEVELRDTPGGQTVTGVDKGVVVEKVKRCG